MRGVRYDNIAHVLLIISFVYNPPRNSRRYNRNFTKQSEEGIKNEGPTQMQIF
jgi:hypothetical protein